jgi:hypothetical protein
MRKAGGDLAGRLEAATIYRFLAPLDAWGRLRGLVAGAGPVRFVYIENSLLR